MHQPSRSGEQNFLNLYYALSSSPTPQPLLLCILLQIVRNVDNLGRVGGVTIGDIVAIKALGHLMGVRLEFLIKVGN